MSTRALGRLYSGMSGGGGGFHRDPTNPGILSQLFGQDTPTGGEPISDVDPTNGMDFDTGDITPYKGSSGLFGSASRQKALELNALREMQKLHGRQGLDLERTRGDEARKTAAAAAVNELAKHLGVTPDKITGSLKDLLGENATAEQQHILDSLDAGRNPGLQDAYNFGARLRGTGLPPTTAFPNIAAGGTGMQPVIPGLTTAPNQNIIQGALQQPTTMGMIPIKDAKGNIQMYPSGHPVGGGQTPGGALFPPDPNKVASVLQGANAPGGNPAMSTNPDWQGGVGYFGDTQRNPLTTTPIAPGDASQTSEVPNTLRGIIQALLRHYPMDDAYRTQQ